MRVNRPNFKPGPLKVIKPPDARKTGIRLILYLLIQRLIHGRR